MSGREINTALLVDVYASTGSFKLGFAAAYQFELKPFLSFNLASGATSMLAFAAIHRRGPNENEETKIAGIYPSSKGSLQAPSTFCLESKDRSAIVEGFSA